MNQIDTAPISAYADILEQAELVASLSFVNIYTVNIGGKRTYLVSDGSEVVQLPTI